MARGWLRALRDTPELSGRVEIVGLVDVEENAARALAQEFSLSVPTGADLAAILAETDADLLFDVVPPAARRAVVLTGLERGCHVLSEKPMATSLEEARFLIARANQAGCLHAVVQNRRFIAGVRRIRAFLESGALGDLTGLHCDFFLAPHFGGFREEMEHPLLLDMAIHTFDAARFMASKTPLAAYALETNPAGSWYAGAAAAFAIFEFSDNVTFTYRGSWCAEGAPTSWEAAWRFTGTRGSLLWDGADRFDARVVAGGGKFMSDLVPVAVPEAPEPEKTHGHASVIAEFLAAIKQGRRPETDGTDNVKSLAMVFAAIESAATARRVEIRQ